MFDISSSSIQYLFRYGEKLIICPFIIYICLEHFSFRRMSYIQRFVVPPPAFQLC